MRSISFAASVATTELFRPLGPEPPGPEVPVEVDARTLSRSNPPSASPLCSSSFSFLGGARCFAASFAASFRSRSLRRWRSSGDSMPASLAALASAFTLAAFFMPSSPISVAIDCLADFIIICFDTMNKPAAPPRPTTRKNMMKPARPRKGTSP